VRRFGKYENVNLVVWDDETIAEKGPDISLLYLMRKSVADFLEQQRVVNFILGMVILLCVVIFSELALSQQIEQIEELSNLYDIINYFMLTFFVTEIAVKIFAYGHLFLIEFINVFDSTIVIVSYVMLILRLKAKILGILRVLRLIKVIINLKRVADEKREQKELIKEQKR
jgi:voltage-gated sodium channel